MWPALLLLGFSSGLPQPLVDSTLSTWLIKSGYSPSELVQVGFVTLPFTLKFLWAPLVDRFVPPWLGRRRGWLCICQLAVIAGVLAMASIDPRTDLAALHRKLPASARRRADVAELGRLVDALGRLDRRPDRFESKSPQARMDFDRLPVIE